MVEQGTAYRGEQISAEMRAVPPHLEIPVDAHRFRPSREDYVFETGKHIQRLIFYTNQPWEDWE